jgi:hypothetical protein
MMVSRLTTGQTKFTNRKITGAAFNADDFLLHAGIAHSHGNGDRGSADV